MACILIIDNDAFFREILRIHLGAIGHEIWPAADAGEGIHHILEGPPDLIVSNLDLPYLSGMELLEAVRREPATSRIPFVILSGSADERDHAEAMRLGATRCLAKPVLLNDLVDAVRSALGDGASGGREDTLACIA